MSGAGNDDSLDKMFVSGADNADSPDKIIIDNKFFRFVVLIGAGFLGLVPGMYTDVQFFCDWGLDKTVAEYVATVAVGVPVFICLWYFRTRDVRQQIKETRGLIRKSREQINQSHFHNAIENLTSKNISKARIGARSLIKLSEITDNFDEIITLAFKNKIVELLDNLYALKESEYRYRAQGEDREFKITNLQYGYRKEFAEEMNNWLPEDKKFKEIMKL